MTKLLDIVPAQLPVGGKCKIAFVGDVPDDYDRLHGFPLVGPSGRTFDQILRIAGLACDDRCDASFGDRAKRVSRLLSARDEYLVTNVFDQQPPKGLVKSWCAPAPERKTWEGYDLPPIGGMGYLRPEHLHYLSRLQQELVEAEPTLIVPLGSTALWALTGSSDIQLGRGSVQRASYLVPGVKILATYHPAHVNQDWRLFHVTVLDLVKAQAEAEFKEVRLARRRIHIRPTVLDLPRWRETLLGSNRLSIDIETAKQQITCIGFAPTSEQAFVVPFVNYEEPSRSYWSTVEAEVAAWKVVKEVCESAVPKTFQNGLYDVYYLIRQANIWPRNYNEDTRLQHHALYPELPKSLAFMGATYGTQGPWKLMASHRSSEKKDA